MLLYTSGLGQIWQMLGVLNLSALTDSTALLVSGAYQLLGDFHTLPQHMLFSSACGFLVTVSPSTFIGTNKTQAHAHTERHFFTSSIKTEL